MGTPANEDSEELIRGVNAAINALNRHDFECSEALFQELLETDPSKHYIQNWLVRVGLEKSGAINNTNIVWVASYPRSGRTWLRFLLTNLLSGSFTHSSVVDNEMMALTAGLDKKFLRTDRINFVFVHETLERTMKIGASFQDRTVGVIYLARNPIDVLVSNINYMLHQLDENDESQIGATMNFLFDDFISGRGLTHWKERGMGDLAEHFESWAALSGTVDQTGKDFPFCLIKYEELKTDTVKVISEICGKFGISKTPEMIENAVKRSSFENMQQLEEQETLNSVNEPDSSGTAARSAFPHARKSGRKLGLRFINKGQSGYGKSLLNDDLYSRAVEAFRPLAEKLDYDL